MAPDRSIADAVIRAVLRACEPGGLVRRCRPPELNPRAIELVGAGKAVVGMTRGLVESLGGQVPRGIVVGPPSSGPAIAPLGPSIGVYEADHPHITQRNTLAGTRVREFVRSAGTPHERSGRTLVVLLSGGASAHLTAPAGMLALGDIRGTTVALLRAGAPIQEINCVRKHCETLKGGGLAALACDEGGFASVLALILSDVIGDRLDVIASGPTAPDPTTYADALAVLVKRGVSGDPALRAVTRHLEQGAAGLHPETRKPGDPLFQRVRNVIVGNNQLAVGAAAQEAERAGLRIEELRLGVTGEAREVGRMFAQRCLSLSAGSAAIWGGETTVTVLGHGRGGRNHEAALSAAIALSRRPGITIACFATDGTDGMSDGAGAVVDGQTCTAARGMGLDPMESLVRNDSAGFFERLGGQIRTGPTGTNVCDVWIGIRK